MKTLTKYGLDVNSSACFIKAVVEKKLLERFCCFKTKQTYAYSEIVIEKRIKTKSYKINN
jgi:hypothetical protein